MGTCQREGCVDPVPAVLLLSLLLRVFTRCLQEPLVFPRHRECAPAKKRDPEKREIKKNTEGRRSSHVFNRNIRAFERFRTGLFSFSDVHSRTISAKEGTPGARVT